MTSLKEQKELFVTGHSGTNPLEILLVCSASPIGVWLLQYINVKSKVHFVVLEAFLLWFPLVLCQTNLLYPWGISFLVLEGVVATYLGRNSQVPPQATATRESQSVASLLTTYRSTVYFLTFVAILAVDFHLFPRRFAKTEVNGYGLMDVGAGSFMFSGGLVSPRARNKSRRWMKDASRILPLVALGSIRLFTNKELDYQEHVSEYGVHWNFFYTLAVVTPFSSLIPGPSWTIPIFLLVAYQLLLSGFDWQTYVESAPRSHCLQYDNTICSFFAANREGVLGCVGYLAIFLIGEKIGHMTLWNTPQRVSQQLWGLSLLSWLCLGVLVNILLIPVSRRTTNVVFCTWTVAHNMTILALLSVSIRRDVVPVGFDAVNRNGLLIFLLANILTGLVNLSINTLEMKDRDAMAIVFTYICIIGTLAVLLDLRLFATGKKQN